MIDEERLEEANELAALTTLLGWYFAQHHKYNVFASGLGGVAIYLDDRKFGHFDDWRTALQAAYDHAHKDNQ